jgi:transcriptional regulator with XRE-family HTH domain
MTQVDLPEKLRYLRKSRGMSQVELAHRLGLKKNNAFVSHLERGTKRPSEALLHKIAEVFAYDYDSLRALAGPALPAAEQVELRPAAHAGLMAQIRQEVELLGERMGELVAGALPDFLWSREQRLIVESASREVWILTPRLAHHGVEADLLAVAAANLRRGACYRYLIADTKEMRVEAGRLLKRYQAAAAGPEPETQAGPEVGFVPHDSFPSIFEAALFDPRDAARIGGCVVPGAGGQEWEIALGREQAVELARHLARLWDRVNVPVAGLRAS